jgi:hypothetical protein
VGDDPDEPVEQVRPGDPPAHPAGREGVGEPVAHREADEPADDDRDDEQHRRRRVPPGREPAAGEHPGRHAHQGQHERGPPAPPAPPRADGDDHDHDDVDEHVGPGCHGSSSGSGNHVDLESSRAGPPRGRRVRELIPRSGPTVRWRTTAIVTGIVRSTRYCG